jgi:hypothetical protein
MQGNHPKFLTKAELQTARADRIKRREFITLLGGGAVAWPRCPRWLLSTRAACGVRSRALADRAVRHPGSPFHLTGLNLT